MANINNINESAQSFAQATARESKNKSAPSFENILNSAVDKKQVSHMEGGMISGLNEIESPAPEIKAPAAVVSGETDSLIKLLESYSSQLDNPDISLKKIAPVLEDIKNNAGKLLLETGRLTDADASLRKLATQTVVTAQTEYLKFQRGDYLS